MDEIIGMTDKQFDAYNRQLLRRIKRVEQLLKDTDNEEAKAELRDILDDFKKSLED
ncbi:MAG: hypothetical protein K2N56_01330 [Oscillospiraceae bacterium]|nr:hypothetical protein [Oscillospiraceae bacterium]